MTGPVECRNPSEDAAVHNGPQVTAKPPGRSREGGGRSLARCRRGRVGTAPGVRRPMMVDYYRYGRDAIVTRFPIVDRRFRPLDVLHIEYGRCAKPRRNWDILGVSPREAVTASTWRLRIA